MNKVLYCQNFLYISKIIKMKIISQKYINSIVSQFRIEKFRANSLKILLENALPEYWEVCAKL